jgi:hypothetical protein
MCVTVFGHSFVRYLLKVRGNLDAVIAGLPSHSNDNLSDHGSSDTVGQHKVPFLLTVVLQLTHPNGLKAEYFTC